MKNIEQILKDAGLEVTDEQKAAINSAVTENYRTKSDYDKQAKKLETAETERDNYKASLDDVQGKLDGFKDVNVEDLKGQIATLTTQLNEEKTARAQDAQKVEREKSVNEFLSSLDENGNKKYEFLNDITENHYRNALMEELSKDSAKGKSIGDIFTGLITGEDGKQKGNIFIDRKQEQLETQRAKPFTMPLNQVASQTQKPEPKPVPKIW